MSQLIGELDDQDTVLRHQPDQHDETDLRVDIERDAGKEQRENCSGKREGHGQEHHQRAGQAFELRDQNEENDHKREQIGHQNVVRGFLEALRFALQQYVDIIGHGLGGETFDLVDRLLQRHSFGNVGFQLDRPTLFGAVKFRRDTLFDDPGDARQGHQATIFRPDVEIAQVRGVRHRDRFGGQEDRHCLIADIEIDDVVAPDHRAQGLGNIVEIDPEVRRALAINLHRELRLGRLVGDIGIGEDLRTGIDRLAERERRLENVVVFAAGQRDLDIAAAPAAEAQRATSAGIGPRAGNLAKRVVQCLDDRGLAAIALAPVGKLRGDADAIGIVTTDDRKGALDLSALEIGLEHDLDLVEFAIHEIEPHAIRTGRIDFDHAAILVRDQFGIELEIKQTREPRDGDRACDHDPAMVEAPPQQRRVALAHIRPEPRQSIRPLVTTAKVELGCQCRNQR